MTGQTIALEQIEFNYKDMALHFDATFTAGAFVAIIGPSGAGKSTLLNLIAGFEMPVAGKVMFNDNDAVDLPPQSRPVSMIFQDHNLFTHLDVKTNIALGLNPTAKINAAGLEQINAALTQVGLDGFADRHPASLSGGERQRVALARTLVRDKPVLLLDEPFAALGPAHRQDMLQLMQKLHHNRNMTILMVTHNPDDARAAASHTVFIENGYITAYGETAQVMNDSNNKALRDYLGT